jgi:putative ABC transport system permease protein
VAFLLFIACANVANGLLARGTTRMTEMAVRGALGASRGRLLRQLLVESLVLSLMAGALGLAIAYVGLQALLRLAPDDLPRAAHIAVDGSALAVTAVLVVLTGVSFGLIPALRATRVDLHGVLKQGSRGGGSGGQRHRLRGALVIAQVAIALVLLTGAGLLIRSFAHLQQVNPGFDARGTQVVETYLPRPQYSDSAQYVAFADRVITAIAANPGLEAVAATANIPFSDHHMTAEIATRFSVVGQPPPRPEDMPKANHYAVSPQYFRAMGIPLLRGRAFNTSDRSDAPQVVIISDGLARRFFPGEDPLSKSLSLGDDKPRAIVGIVGDTRHSSLEAAPTLQVYQPFAQFPDNDIIYVVRSAPGADSGTGAVIRAAVAGIDAQVPVYNARPLHAAVAASIARQRFGMTLFAVFSGVALVLAALGTYGVMAYSVSQRTGEIGIRMALGAQPGEVMRLVLVYGGRLVILGVLAGLVGALLLAGLLERLLFGIGARDPLTFALTVALLAVIAGAACLVPARRATKVQPMTVLRDGG